MPVPEKVLSQALEGEAEAGQNSPTSRLPVDRYPGYRVFLYVIPSGRNVGS